MHEIANATDYAPIHVHFRLLEVALLFAELIESRGYRTRLIPSDHPIPTTGKLITEPGCYEQLSIKPRREDCLIVGDPEQLSELEVITLERPLTESKIDNALTEFLCSIKPENQPLM